MHILFSFVCIASGENSKEGIEQLWRTMEEFLPKSTIRSVYQRQFLNIGHKYMRSIINALFKLNVPLDDPNNLVSLFLRLELSPVSIFYFGVSFVIFQLELMMI